MTDELGSIDGQVAALSLDIDAGVRQELQQALRTLRDAGNPIGAVLSMPHLSLILMKNVFESAGYRLPSYNLYECIVAASNGDEDNRIKGLDLIPREVASHLHVIRTLSNKVTHRSESLHPTTIDAEYAIVLFLRIVEWFYVEYQHGPRLKTIYIARKPIGEQDNASPRLRYAIENTFPRPIARAFYQLRGIDDWRAEIPQLANILGVTLQHLAIVALAEYFAGETRDKALNARLLEIFKKPLALGHWAGILRETLTFLGAQTQEAFSSELRELYFPWQGETSIATIQAMSDSLITARNRLVHAPSDKPPTREEHDGFKRGLIEFLQLVAFLKDYPLLSVKNTETQHGIKTHRCHLHMGAHDEMDEVEVQSDIDMEKSRIAMLRPAANELLYLYPFYTLRQCPTCGAAHLFRFERMEKGRLHYVATGGHQLREDGAGSDLVELIEGSWNVEMRLKAGQMYIESTDTWHRLPVGHKVDKKYEVVEHLRRGGMADVYKVRHIGEADAFLAMKLLPFQFLSDRTMVARFRKEATQSESLTHPNITHVLNHGMDVADHYLIMELAPGWTTPDGRQALDAGELSTPLDESVALNIVKQACEGLHYIHQPGVDIVHRDVKPGNLLLFDDGRVKLADFGIARSREAMNRTMTGQAMGTPEYISPEQAEGKKELTYATDIYSMGVVLYELLTGQTPFKRTTPLATMLARLHESAPPPRTFKPEMPARLQSIVMKCLERDPERRFRSARELYDAILSYEQQPGTEDKSPTLEAPSMRAVTATAGRVRGTWAPVKGATSYVVELTHNLTGEKWTHETDQIGWESEPLDAGSYRVQVCAKKRDEATSEWSREVEVKLAVFVPREAIKPPRSQGFYEPTARPASPPTGTYQSQAPQSQAPGKSLDQSRRASWGRVFIPALVVVAFLGIWAVTGGVANWPMFAPPQLTPTPTEVSISQATSTALATSTAVGAAISPFLTPEPGLKSLDCIFEYNFNVCDTGDRKFKTWYLENEDFLGTPISQEFVDLQIGIWVQYFGMGRLEWVSQDKGSRPSFGLLGNDLLRPMAATRPKLQRALSVVRQPQPDCVSIPGYPHWLCNSFRDFYRAGLLGKDPVGYYGYPITEEYWDTLKGELIQRQFFQRAIFQAVDGKIERLPLGVLYLNWVRGQNIPMPPGVNIDPGDVGPTTSPTQGDAIVNTLGEVLNLRTGPSLSFTIIGQYPDKTSVTVHGRDASDKFLWVETPDGKRGWMEMRWLLIYIPLQDVPVVDSLVIP